MAYPELVKLEGEKREIGKKVNESLRTSLRVPAVLYGPDIEENIHFSIDELELEKILRTPQSKLQELTVEGKTYKTLLKHTAYDPVTDRPLHADFYVLSPKQPVTLRVPIRLIGNSRGVVESGGRIFQPMKFVRIRVLPDAIPADFEVDITPLGVGQSFHVADLELEGITPLDGLSRTIVTIRPPKGADFLDELIAGGEEGEEAAEETTAEAPADASGEAEAPAGEESTEE